MRRLPRCFHAENAREHQGSTTNESRHSKSAGCNVATKGE
jgi:hypothetical protein